MKVYHKLYFISLILIVLFLVIFLLIAEGNYVKYDDSLTVNFKSHILNLLFSILLIFNLILTIICVLRFGIDSFNYKENNFFIIFLDILPVLLLLCISSFKLDNLSNFIIAPFKIFLQEITYLLKLI
ncbi:hypothetical protein UT300018_21700 [Clostridium faecium]